MQRFTPSLIDRLLDGRSDTGLDHVLRGFTLEQMKDCVARDLESLLNSRMALNQGHLDDYPQAQQSVLTFGMNDFVGKSLGRAEDREAICQAISSAITRHEPRLREVVVNILRPDAKQRQLNFSVTALLVLDPATEAVSFDAMLQPLTQQYAVTSTRRVGLVARQPGAESR